ncbi:MAG: carbohydrate ABC transporter permease [Ruminococcaceae bacterium]|nr:carbohydrate ABC transporter permease [Oscillospiraceae bacterium]
MKMRMKRGALSYWLLWAGFLLIAAVVVLPILFTFFASFMSPEEVARNYGEMAMEGGFTPIHLLPDQFSLAGYREVLVETPQYLTQFWTSVFICLSICAGQVALSIFGGYAFSRFRFPGRDAIFFCVIVLMVLPHQVTLAPSYMVIKALGLLNTSAALILPGIFSAFGLFFMRQVMASIPESTLEAASLDGANSFVALWRVLVPCCSSGITALALLSFVDAWSMIEQPIMLIQDTFRQPLSVFLLRVGQENLAVGFACGVLFIVPVLFLLLLFEEQLVEGIVRSEIK